MGGGKGGRGSHIWGLTAEQGMVCGTRHINYNSVIFGLDITCISFESRKTNFFFLVDTHLKFFVLEQGCVLKCLADKTINSIFSLNNLGSTPLVINSRL